MKRVVLFMMLLTSASLLSATTNQEIKQEAKGALMKMGSALKANMKKNMKAGGPVQAASFCLEEASKIAKKVNASYPKGVNVKRVSLKYRNPADKPTSDEAKVLIQMQKDVDAGKTIPKMIVKEIGKNSYKVYKPIFINKGICLTCHGDAQTRDHEAYKLIHAKYPNDRAINYKKGDFRGAFVITIVK
ncbi:Cytochrome c family protein [hydrothermal vent metagenome]|uniref:Cytochrome c family protein n=1 Tax=hydrothermal vent metagenome TaxID=652676 RepID=A0A1W1BIV4_9ZZZZ